MFLHAFKLGNFWNVRLWRFDWSENISIHGFWASTFMMIPSRYSESKLLISYSINPSSRVNAITTVTKNRGHERLKEDYKSNYSWLIKYLWSMHWPSYIHHAKVIKCLITNPEWPVTYERSVSPTIMHKIISVIWIISWDTDTLSIHTVWVCVWGWGWGRGHMYSLQVGIAIH